MWALLSTLLKLIIDNKGICVYKLTKKVSLEEFLKKYRNHKYCL